MSIISGPELLPLQVVENVSYTRREQGLLAELEKYGGQVTLSNANVVTNENVITYKFYDKFIHVKPSAHQDFYNEFRFYIVDGKTFIYDNLINLCFMVKNAGNDFRQVLIDNLPYIDRWTILDTGSTDNT